MAFSAALTALMDCINDPSSKPQSFLKKLRHHQKNVDLTTITRQGRNLLHECILQKRSEFFSHLAHVRVFLSLYDQSVGEENTNGSMATTELAIKEASKVVRDELERILNICKEIKTDELRKQCLAGSEKRVKEILDTSKYAIRRNSQWTTVYCAVVSENEEVLRMILDVESKLSTEDQDYHKELGYIVNYGVHNLLEILCSCREINLNEVLLDGRSLVEVASINGDETMFKALLSAGAITSSTVLALAASNGQYDFIKFILHDYPLEFHIDQCDVRNKRPLHFAVERNRIDTVRLLLANSADVTALDKRGRSVIHTAADCGHLKTLELLIAHCSEKGVLPSLLSRKDKYLGSELCFLVRGNDQNQAAWHYVLVDRALLCTFRVKTHGGAVDVAKYGRVIKSGWGLSPLPEVVKEVEDRFDMVNITHEAAADMTPLHCAILKNNTKCAILLMDHGADINAIDSSHLTPLHLACTQGNTAVIQDLLKRGATRAVADLKNRTPKMLQMHNDHMDIMANIDESNEMIKNVDTFLEEVILPMQQQLSQEQLNTREDDLKEYIRDRLRELVANVNDFLYYKCGVIAVTSPTDQQQPT